MTPQKAPVRLDTPRNGDLARVPAGNLVLRPIRRSDQGLIGHWTADPRVARMTRTIPHPLPPGASEAFVTRILEAEAPEATWAVDGHAAGLSELLGVISLEPMDRNQWEIGYWIAPAMWNAGIASTAVQALVAANPMGCATIFASVFQDNPASAQVLRNAGFEDLGDAETYSVARGEVVSTWTFIHRLGAPDPV
jgi:RimJ/RimL family protein N-acetyltransferase